MMPSIRHHCQQKSATGKGEDFYCSHPSCIWPGDSSDAASLGLCGASVSFALFGVFDGHGGQAAGAHCRDALLREFLAALDARVFEDSSLSGSPVAAGARVRTAAGPRAGARALACRRTHRHDPPRPPLPGGSPSSAQSRRCRAAWQRHVPGALGDTFARLDEVRCAHTKTRATRLAASLLLACAVLTRPLPRCVGVVPACARAHHVRRDRERLRRRCSGRGRRRRRRRR